MTKNFLFVLRKPSYDGIYVQEMFDIILTTAAFEQEVSILLLDDAVFHLKSNQTARKNIATLFEILPTMDVDAIFVETESLAERGLKLDMLTQPVELKSRATISDFMTTFDVVFAG
jgi:tRNA 2-thiouridine synthesizing protein C